MRRRGAGVLAGAAVFALFFARALSPHVFLFRRDVFQLYLPLEEFIAGELRAGRFPTWFPFDGVGISLVGSSIAGLLHPRHLLDLLLSPDQALKWSVLLCYPIAAWGAARLVARLGAGHAAQALAALGYALCGYLLSVSDNPPYLLAAAVLPWTALAAEALGHRPSARAIAGLALALAFAAWSGDVQSALLQSVLAAGIVLSHGRSRAHGTALAASAGVLALLTAPLLPALAAAALGSGRLAGLDPEMALRWSLVPARLVELAVGAPWPSAFAGDFGHPFVERYLTHEPRALWAVSVQAGTALVALAIVAAARHRKRPIALYGALTLLALWLALGKHAGLYGLLLHLPVWNAFRYPEKLLPFAMLGLAVLGGLGVGALLRAPRGQWLSLGAAGLALFALGVAWPGLVAPPLAADPEILEGVAAAGRIAFASAGLILVALAVVAKLGDRRWLWLAPALQLAQALPLAGWVVRVEPTTWLERRSPLLARARAAAPEGRICSDALQLRFDQPPQEPAYEVSVRSQIDALAADHNARVGLGNVLAAAPGFPGALRRICDHPFCGGRCARRTGAPAGVLDGATFEALQQRGANLRVQQRIRDPELVLYSDPAARPYAEPTGVHFVADSSALLEALSESPDSPPQQVLLVGSGADWPAPRGAVATSRPAPDRISAAVELDSAGWVVIRESCEAGWRATLDGAPVPLSRADLAFCAAQLPAGRHQLELRYQPPGWPWLWIFYAAGLVLTAALAFISRKSNGAGP